MNKYKDTDLREALKRKYADEPQLPADFMAKMERRLDKRTPLWRWVAAAACFLLIIGIGLYYQKHDPLKGEIQSATANHSIGHGQLLNRARPIAQSGTADSSIGHGQFINRPRSVAQSTAVSSSIDRGEFVNRPRSVHQSTAVSSSIDRGELTNRPRSIEQPTALPDENLHYAALIDTDDTVKYQAPSRVDDFIAKMAEYNKVKAVHLDCSGSARDTSIVGTAYLFDDARELDLFGRLLQVACCYDSKTPGYLLNFSHQQFFFCLKDLRKGEKYLWIAERINGGRILLFSTHSPIEAEVSSACFQEYREQLTHTNIKTLQF